MANPYLILWCDPTKNKIYSGWMENTDATTPILKQGDNIGVEVHWVTRPEFGAPMEEVTFPESAAITLAVGKVDSFPTDGTFTITYDGETTPDLPYDILATEMETALNNLSTIDAQGGVTVSRLGSYFRIVWNDRAVFTDEFTANVDALSPTSEYQFVQTKAGSASANRTILLKIRQSVIAGTSTFTPTAAPAISVENLYSNVWRVSIDPTPKDGVFSLTFGGGVSPAKQSPAFSISVSSFDMQADLNALNIGTFSVNQVGPYIWDISVPAAATVITAQNGIIGFSSMYGVLNMNTAEVDEFLAGSESGEAKLEVQVDIDGEIQTLVQATVVVINDLINNSSFQVVDLGTVIPSLAVVRYDTSQSLTSGEQDTARANIGAASAADLSALETDVANAQGEIDNLPTLAYSAGTVETGGVGTTIKNDDYPDEITITIGGVSYRVPARLL